MMILTRVLQAASMASGRSNAVFRAWIDENWRFNVIPVAVQHDPPDHAIRDGGLCERSGFVEISQGPSHPE